MRRRRGFARAVMMMIHAVVIIVALIVVARVRFGSTWITVWDDLLPRPGLTIVGYVGIAIAVFALVGLYRFDDPWSLRRAITNITQAVVVLGLVTLSLLFFFKLDQVSRLYLLGLFLIIWIGIILSTIAVRQGFAWARRSGYAARHVVIVGSGADASRFVRDLTVEHPELGIQIDGFLGPVGAALDSFERLGEVEDLPTVLSDSVVDEVVVCLPIEEWPQIDSVVRYSEQQGVPVRVPLPVMDYTIAHGRLDQISGNPVLTLVVGPDQTIQLGIKRMLDIALSVIGLVLLSPVLLVTGVVLLVIEGRPVLFSQRRAGLHGRPFDMLKFRTMCNGAEEQRSSLDGQNERTGPTFKMSDDPRVTGVGRVLRRTSIDELPQLWNVFIGKMSLVGPRPPTIEEVANYDLRHRRRLSMRPGITGLWQVTARDDPSFERWVDLDLEYIDNWSLLGDLGLLVRTPVALVRHPGK